MQLHELDVRSDAHRTMSSNSCQQRFFLRGCASVFFRSVCTPLPRKITFCVSYIYSVYSNTTHHHHPAMAGMAFYMGVDRHLPSAPGPFIPERGRPFQWLEISFPDARTGICAVRAPAIIPNPSPIAVASVRIANSCLPGPTWPCPLGQGCCNGQTECSPEPHPHL